MQHPAPRIWANQPRTLVPCWMPEPLPPRNQCTGCFAPTLHHVGGGTLNVYNKWSLLHNHSCVHQLYVQIEVVVCLDFFFSIR